MKTCTNCGNRIAWLVVIGWQHLDVDGWLDCDDPRPAEGDE